MTVVMDKPRDQIVTPIFISTFLYRFISQPKNILEIGQSYGSGNNLRAQGTGQLKYEEATGNLSL